MADIQEVFNKAVMGVIEQGGPAIKMNTVGSKSCAYRGNDGAKCAVGHILPDRLAIAADFFGLMPSDVVGMMSNNSSDRSAKFIKKFETEILDIGDINVWKLLTKLQAAHDEAFSDMEDASGDFLRDFKANCHDIAKEYDLEVPF